jgi:hypothetical protein
MNASPDHASGSPVSIDARVDPRARIAAAESNVELQRAILRQRSSATRARVDAVRERVDAVRSRWHDRKALLVVVGGLLLGVMLGRRRASSTVSHRHHSRFRGAHDAGVDAPPSAAAETVKAAGKAAGWMAGLSLASRMLPVVLSLLSLRAGQRARGSDFAATGEPAGTDWWAVARALAPLVRR